MLLNRMSPDRQNDEGGALIAVIGIATVTAIIAVTVSTAAVHGLAMTSSARASVQARAASEAGIDVAVVGLQTPGNCEALGGVYATSPSPTPAPSATSTLAPIPDPKYRAVIEHNAGSGWVVGCPPAAATQVRIRSTGFAEAKGVAGASSGDSRLMEAVYNYIPDYVAIPHIDAAVYAHTMLGDFKNFILDSADNNLSADLQIKSGSVNCINGARIAGDVILGNGSATLKNCEVTGSIHASGLVDANDSHIHGDIIAVGSGVAAGSDVVRVHSGSTADGDIYSGGNVSVLSGSASTVKGNITVAGTPANKANVASGSTVLGNVISSGAITAGGTIVGTKTPAVGGLVAPPVPLIPNWTDVSFPSPTWAANDYQEISWTGDCDVSGTHPMWTTLSARTTPTVVNAMNCTAGVSIDNNVTVLTLQTNIAFMAPKFYINKLKLVSPATRGLWFIQPDNVADGQPTCPSPAAGGITMTNESDIPTTVSVMVYTPCKVYSDRDGFRGQIYGGEVQFGQQAKLTFSPVGIPGVDFSGGVPPTMVLNGGHLGNRVGVRELSTN